jgi:pyrrolidone-carboxylate peptidase
MTRVLVFGFGPFGSVNKNPAEQLIHDLKTDRKWPCSVSWRVFAVDFATLGGDIERALQKVDVAIGIGVWLGITAIRIERNAANAFLQNPNEQKTKVSCSIDPALPDTLSSRIDLHNLQATLHSSGVPAYISRDADIYACNYAYFRSLAVTGGRAIFLHVPIDSEQAIKKGSHIPSLPYEMIRRAVAAVIEQVVTERVEHGHKKTQEVENPPSRGRSHPRTGD